MRLTLLGLLVLAATSAQAGGGHVLTVSAAVVSNSNCRFSASSSSLTVAIDAASTSTASASTSLSFRCNGGPAIVTWSLSTNSGLYGANPSALRMRHGTASSEYLPYSLTYPASGTAPKNVTQTIPLSMNVAPADFQNALPGSYTDTVTLSLLP